MKNTILILSFAFASVPALSKSDTTFECRSKSGDRVLIAIESDFIEMEIRTAAKWDAPIERHVFPRLNPFLENAEGNLVSLTHVASVISSIGQGKKNEQIYPYISLTIDMNTETPSIVKWKFIQSGDDDSFEVLCDKKGIWKSLDTSL